MSNTTATPPVSRATEAGSPPASTPPFAPPRSRVARVLAFPVTWMVIGIAAIVVTDILCIDLGAGLGTPGQVVGAIVGGVVAVLIYQLVMRRLARRRPTELASTGALRQGLLGSALGAAFIVAAVGIVTLLGGFRIGWHPVDAVNTIALAIAVNFGAAAVEEIVFRGFAFRAIEQLFGRGRGTWIALSVTSLCFGAVHMLNPGASLWSGLAIAIEAGVLLGAAFAWRRNLWFVIGIHFAWNALEGLFGIAVSGHRDPGLLLTVATGPAAISGGAFGVEASVVPVLISIAISIPMIIAARRANRHG
jgi:membrane protease YdiL (CAAX protease family)